MEFIQHTDDQSRHLHSSASDLLGRLSLSDRPQFASTGTEPVQLISRTAPLAIVANGDANTWTEWPPLTTENSSDTSPAILYRSAGGDQRLAPPETEKVELKRLDQVVAPESKESKSEIQAVSVSIAEPLATYNFRSLLYWLGSDDQSQRRQAEVELLRRGWSQNQMMIAMKLAVGNVANRLEMLDRVTHDPNIDPRPWLLWLLDDPERDIKIRAVQVLSTMSDPAIAKQLRERLNEESDSLVAARIRMALQLQ
jgi:hypothetical protein